MSKLEFIRKQFEREQGNTSVFITKPEFRIKETKITPVVNPLRYTYEAQRNYKLRMEEAYQLGNKVTDIYSSMQWKGSSCIIVGGGPSLIGFNFESLRGRRVIGVNRTFESYDGCDILFSMDTRYYQWLKSAKIDYHLTGEMIKKWKRVKSRKIFLSPLDPYKFEPDIYLIRRLPVGDVSFSLEGGLYCADNSGFGAMMLAIALGCNPIYLLGFDLNKRVSRTHNHEPYPFPFAHSKYERMIGSFNEMAPKLVKAGVKVYNLNPYSGIRCFPFLLKKGKNQ